MSKFVYQSIKRVDKLNPDQIKKLLHNLAEENELLSMVHGSVDMGIIISNNSHKIIYSNRPLGRMIPVNTNLSHQADCWKLIKDTNIASVIEETLLSQETIRNREFVLDLGGCRKVLTLSIVPLVSKGTIKGSVISFVDVTERKNLEAQLRRAKGLVSLSTMTAGIAHEIKNPLGSMAIYIQLMQKMLKKDGNETPTEELLSYLDIVSEEVDRLNSIVVDYLFAVKPIDATLVHRDLGSFLQELVEFIRKEMEIDGIELEYHQDDKLGWVSMDDKLIKQAMLNLIKNAQHAMPEGGKLTIDCAQRGEHIELTVTDTGSGIPLDVQEKMFEPYFTTKSTGTGLGLTLVYKIIKEHGGDMEVTSKEGKGTTFLINLPVEQEKRKLLTICHDCDGEGDS